MPAWTQGRLRTLIFVSLLVAALLVVVSFAYFRARPRIPEGAEMVTVPGRTLARTVARVRVDAGHHGLGPALPATGFAPWTFSGT